MYTKDRHSAGTDEKVRNWRIKRWQLRQILLYYFWPIYNVPWNLHANSFCGICIKSTNQQAKSMRKQYNPFAQVIKFFVKYQAQGGGVNSKPLPLRTPLYFAISHRLVLQVSLEFVCFRLINVRFNIKSQEIVKKYHLFSLNFVRSIKSIFLIFKSIFFSF